MMRIFGRQDRGRGSGGGSESPAILPQNLTETGFAVLDLEMTGLDPGRESIVSLGAVHMTGGRIECGDSFYSLVKPRTGLSPESVCVHEITPTEAAGGADAEAALDAFLGFCGDRILVGYCLDLDLAFLSAELTRLRRPRLANRTVDVAALYLAIRAGHGSALLEGLPLGRVDLYSIARALGVEVHGAHNALADAFIAAQVFQRFLSLLGSPDDRSGVGLERVLEAGNPASFKRGLRHAAPFTL
jgi:DNA polymerase-3 subunit epsilon